MVGLGVEPVAAERYTQTETQCYVGRGYFVLVDKFRRQSTEKRPILQRKTYE